MVFEDRNEAGHILAEKLGSIDNPNCVVVGLARGGVVVGAAIAGELKIPLDVLVIKKISSPQSQELGIGALAPDGVYFVDWKLAAMLGADEAYVNSKIKQLSEEMRQTVKYYRKFVKPVKLNGKTVILTDDGVATGATIKAAVRWLKTKSVSRIIPAIPVAPAGFAASIRSCVTGVIILQEQQNLIAVGDYYRQFGQVSEGHVIELLGKGVGSM